MHCFQFCMIVCRNSGSLTQMLFKKSYLYDLIDTRYSLEMHNQDVSALACMWPSSVFLNCVYFAHKDNFAI